MSGKSAIMITLQSCGMLWKCYHHFLVGVTDILVGVGGGYGASGSGYVPAGWRNTCWDGVGRGDKKHFLIYWRCSNVASARSMLTRASILIDGVEVHSRNHSMNGPKLWEIPIAFTFASSMCHTLDGDRNGAAIIRWTRKSRSTETKGNHNLSSLGVPSGMHGVPSGWMVNATYISASRGTSLSSSSIHAGSISMVAGSCPSQTSHAKARTFSPSGIGYAKDRVVYWVPQITLM